MCVYIYRPFRGSRERASALALARAPIAPRHPLASRGWHVGYYKTECIIVLATGVLFSRTRADAAGCNSMFLPFNSQARSNKVRKYRSRALGGPRGVPAATVVHIHIYIRGESGLRGQNWGWRMKTRENASPFPFPVVHSAERNGIYVICLLRGIEMPQRSSAV